jgi:hypothetical protein
MKKVSIVSYLIVANAILFFGCASQPQPKLLVLEEISEDILLHSVSILVRKNLDSDGLGEKSFRMLYIEKINNIKEILANEGVIFDERVFLNEYHNSPIIKFEAMKVAPTFVMHRYFWESKIKPETHLELIINLVILEDGSMPLKYTVKKTDPLYEHGHSTGKTISIIVSE